MRFESFVSDIADAWASVSSRSRRRTRYAATAMRAVEAIAPGADEFTWSHVCEAVGVIVLQSTVGTWTDTDAAAAHWHLRRVFGLEALPPAAAPPELALAPLGPEPVAPAAGDEGHEGRFEREVVLGKYAHHSRAALLDVVVELSRKIFDQEKRIRRLLIVATSSRQKTLSRQKGYGQI